MKTTPILLALLLATAAYAETPACGDGTETWVTHHEVCRDSDGKYVAVIVERTIGECAAADINHDGKVGAGDFTPISECWGAEVHRYYPEPEEPE